MGIRDEKGREGMKREEERKRGGDGRGRSDAPEAKILATALLRPTRLPPCLAILRSLPHDFFSVLAQ